jgi:serine/threonine protein kinase
MLRERRRKVDVKGFEMGRVIGHGAFGVVRIAREYQSGRLVAIKQLRKAE